MRFEKLFKSETTPPQRPSGRLGETHVPDFEDIPRKPASTLTQNPQENPEVQHLFEGEHLKAEVLQNYQPTDNRRERQARQDYKRQLPGREAAAIQHHLGTCKSCREGRVEKKLF